MTTFPSYADLLFSGYSEQRESALLRTEMESGPAKQAKTKSRVLVTRQATVLLRSRADYLSFISWYSSDLDEGASWFSFVDRVRNTTITARFAEGGFEAVPLSPSLESWSIPVKIETWG